MANLIAVELIATRIFEIRGKKVMLDRDLAFLYGVSTKRLNEQVKRNTRRFPADFMFQLTALERDKVVANCDHLQVLKFSYQLPYAFTGQGVAMLSGVLNSERAIAVNILIMRAFVKLREVLLSHKDLAAKIAALERKYAGHDRKIRLIFAAIKGLVSPAKSEPRVIKGFANGR